MLISVIPPSMHLCIFPGCLNGSATHATICPLDSSSIAGNRMEIRISQDMSIQFQLRLLLQRLYILHQSNLLKFLHPFRLLIRNRLLQFFHASRYYCNTCFPFRFHWHSNLHLITPHGHGWTRDDYAHWNPVLERHGRNSENRCGKLHRLSLWRGYNLKFGLPGTFYGGRT